MNYLYAKLNKEAEKLKYKGVDTPTVDMNVNNSTYTISANVKNVHDSRIPELTGEEGFCVPFVNEAGTAFQIGSLPSECLDNGSVTTEKIANGAVTTNKLAFHLYQHTVCIKKYGTRFYMLNDNATPYAAIGDLPDFTTIPASGSYLPATLGATVEIYTKASKQNGTLYLGGVSPSNNQYIAAALQSSSTVTVEDTVTQLI